MITNDVLTSEANLTNTNCINNLGIGILSLYHFVNNCFRLLQYLRVVDHKFSHVYENNDPLTSDSLAEWAYLFVVLANICDNLAYKDKYTSVRKSIKREIERRLNQLHENGMDW